MCLVVKYRYIGGCLRVMLSVSDLFCRKMWIFLRKSVVNFGDWRKVCIFANRNGNFGLMAEWLGRGLQNLVQRFESASDLQRISTSDWWKSVAIFCSFKWFASQLASLAQTKIEPAARSRNPAETIAHLGNGGCRDRIYLLLGLRPALYSVPASLGFALHFESLQTSKGFRQATDENQSLFFVAIRPALRIRFGLYKNIYCYKKTFKKKYYLCGSN